MVVGGYLLHMYCDAENESHGFKEFPHVFTAEHGATARRQARNAGWAIKKDGTALCPRCSGKK